MAVANNPILKGFYPDPSVCRVGEDYYLVNSTFAYVPGVPVFHSRDLVNWEQIGNVLERESQLPLDGATISRGIFAPTIRWNDGVFYMITTNVSHGQNFYVTATNPAGPWSDPIYLQVPEGVDPGIDPSLYFEGDRCYYIGQRQKPNARFYGDCEVWIQELDLKKGALVGEGKALYSGAMQDACWVEGPHLYKIGDYYYITCAEQGTCYEHSVSVARSRDLMGPYENYRCNPLVTHRHLGHQYPIQNIGHGDLVDTPDGNWYLIMLGTRPIDGITELGRETFIAEVTWEDEWPVVNVGEGRVRDEQEIKLPEVLLSADACPAWEERIEMRFTRPLDKRLMFYRHPAPDMYEIVNEKEVLLKMADARPYDVDKNISYIGMRQQARSFQVSIQAGLPAEVQGEAGLLYMHDDENYISLTVCRDANGFSVKALKSEKRIDGETERKESILGSLIMKEPEGTDGVLLTIKGENQTVSLYAEDQQLVSEVCTRFLSSELAGGFVGCTYGLYAAGTGKGYAHLKDFLIENK